MMKSLVLLLAFLGIVSSSFAATVNLAWDANDPLESVDLYRVYEVSGANYTFLKSVTVTNASLANVTSGKHTYVVTAVNTWQLESPYSDPVSTPNLTTKPKNLRIVTVTVP